MTRSKAAKKAAKEASEALIEKGLLGKVRTVSAKFEWKIQGFRACCNIAKVGNMLESPNFVTSVNGKDVEWYLILYPRGQTKDFKNFLSLYLYTEFTGKIEATSSFKVLNNKAKVVLNHTVEKSNYGCKTAWGTDKLASADFILNRANGMLTDGNLLTIVCELTIIPECQITLPEPNEDVEKQKTDLELRVERYNIYMDLLNDSKFSDVALVSESKTIRAHKCILGKMSTVFSAIFDAEMRERKEIIIEVNDIRYDVLIEMVRFIYTGEVNDIEKVVYELMIAAKKYALHRLIIMCESTMIKSLNIHNVIDRLLLAEEKKINNLKIKAIEFIVSNGSNVIDQQNFRLLPADIMLQVCSSLAKKFEL